MASNEVEALTETTELDLSELARSRACLYGVLSLTSAKPVDEHILEKLRQLASLEKQPIFGILCEKVKSGLRKMELWLENNSANCTKMTALNAEFTRLFRGLGRVQSPPPPYESVYLEDGLLYGSFTARVAELYRRFGLRVCNNEPPDHIAFELDFMRFLCEKEAIQWRTSDDALELLKEEYHFLSEHLAKWVPDFCEDVRSFGGNLFYTGLVDVIEGWIQYDMELVTAITELQCEGAKPQRGPD